MMQRPRQNTRRPGGRGAIGPGERWSAVRVGGPTAVIFDAVRTRYTTGRALDATRVVDSLEELLAPDALADLLPRSDA